MEIPAEVRAADQKLCDAAKGLKVLDALNWPRDVRERFLAAWEAGAPRLPDPPPVQPRPPEQVAALEALARPVADHPLARFVARTAGSYAAAARMLGAAGTPAFAELSHRLYGGPSDRVGSDGVASREAALRVIRATDDLARSCFLEEADYCLTPETVAQEMSDSFRAFFTDDPVRVEIDPGLTAKAAAGAETVRIRGSTCFSRYDVDQLVHHEGFVHTATLLNGRRQPNLGCLGLGAPRTTATQEGLATFAEFINASLDLSRLRRLALRIEAVARGLEGADFVEVFRFFLDAGQTPTESFQSTARIFRGGDPRGGVVFTKDAVYLRGLVRTHTFLHAALAARKVEYTHYLFAGRLTWGDVVDLEPCFADGVLLPPRYAPEWLANRNGLAAYLAFSTLTHSLGVDRVRLEDFVPGME